MFLYVSGDFGVVEHGVDGGDGGDAQGDCLECQYAPAEVSGRVEFLDRAQDIVHQADEQSDRAASTQRCFAKAQRLRFITFLEMYHAK